MTTSKLKVNRVSTGDSPTRVSTGDSPARGSTSKAPTIFIGLSAAVSAGDSPTNGTGSFNSSYTATDTYASFATHSNFYPYVTSIGLYNDSNELLVVGKVGKPIKLSDELDTTFILRFDI